MVKKNKCSSLGCEYFIYKAKKCLLCYKKLHPEEFSLKRSSKVIKVSKKRIKQVSDNQVKRLEKYYKLRKVYLLEHPYCELCLLKGIKEPSEDIHHSSGRVGAKLFEDFKALSRKCHIYAENYPLEMIELGITNSRFKT